MNLFNIFISFINDHNASFVCVCVCRGGILIIFTCVFRSDVTEWTNLGWCSFYLCSHTFWFSGVSALYVCVSQCRGMHFVQLNSNTIFRQFISNQFSMTFLDAILHNTECCNLFGLSDNLIGCTHVVYMHLLQIM